jgi:hypothetical protein
MDQWVLDEPKVCLYEDFFQIGKLIATKVISMGQLHQGSPI